MMVPALHPVESARLQTAQDLALFTFRREEAFGRVVHLAKQFFDVPICAFSVIDSTRQIFKVIEGLDVSETSRAISFCGHAILSKDILNIPDTHHDARFADNPLVIDEPHIRFYAGAPVFAPNGMPVGALCIVDRQPRELTGDQLCALRSFADIVQDELILRRQPVRDPLTGVYSQHFADHALRTELRRAYRGQLPLAVLQVNVDNLQAINDRHGYGAGDEVLRCIADCIASRCRRSGDFIARFGGDKFLVVLPETPIAETRAIAERILESVRSLPPKGPPDTGSDHVTATIGGVVVRDIAHLGYGPDLILLDVDRRLADAKSAGRDCAVIEELR